MSGKRRMNGVFPLRVAASLFAVDSAKIDIVGLHNARERLLSKIKNVVCKLAIPTSLPLFASSHQLRPFKGEGNSNALQDKSSDIPDTFQVLGSQTYAGCQYFPTIAQWSAACLKANLPVSEFGESQRRP